MYLPVAYASRALMNTERRYALIEEYLLGLQFIIKAKSTGAININTKAWQTNTMTSATEDAHWGKWFPHFSCPSEATSHSRCALQRAVWEGRLQGRVLSHLVTNTYAWTLPCFLYILEQTRDKASSRSDYCKGNALLLGSIASHLHSSRLLGVVPENFPYMINLITQPNMVSYSYCMLPEKKPGAIDICSQNIGQKNTYFSR